MRRYVFLITIFLICVFIAHGTAFAFSISGPDEINPGGNAQYSVGGISGDVIWSATSNFGTGGDISQDGILTTGSNACGAVTVTAYVGGSGVTKDVRVTYGIWSSPETICYSSCAPQWCIDGCEQQLTPCVHTDGKYRYELSWGRKWRNQEPITIGSDCTQYCSSGSCPGEGPMYHFATLRYEWACPSCTGDTDTDGDEYNSYGSCNNATDCNDNDATIHPGAEEVCGDGKDNDCDGKIDEACNKPSPPAEPVRGCPVRKME